MFDCIRLRRYSYRLWSHTKPDNRLQKKFSYELHDHTEDRCLNCYTMGSDLSLTYVDIACATCTSLHCTVFMCNVQDLTDSIQSTSTLNSIGSASMCTCPVTFSPVFTQRYYIWPANLMCCLCECLSFSVRLGVC